MATLYAPAYIGSATRNAGGTAAWFFQGFRVDRPAQVTSLRLYHPVQGTGTGGLPDRIRLFDSDGATSLASDDLSGVTWPGSGTGAWVDVPLSVPVDLTPGAHYTVGYRAPANYGYAFDSAHPAMSENAGQSWLVAEGPTFHNDSYTGIVATASGETPASSSTTNYNSFRVGADVTAVTTTIEAGDVAEQFSDWLDTTTGTQADSAPLQTYTLATGATGFDAIKAVADAIAAAVSGIPGTIASAVTTITGQLTTLTGNTAQSGIATIGAISHDLAGVINHALDTFTGTGGGAPGALSGRTAFPTVLWTMADSVDFTFQKSWDVPADLYTITLAGIPSRINTVDVDGATWRPRVGWWAIRNGDLLSRRDFLSWESNYVEDGGRRMQGIVVRTQPEVTGTIEAWRLT
jgi:hypothetical protein